ncbi:nitrate reductase [Veronia pacifica]|uniref:Nitrate reductase n=1 Tax=Veronia pacifica TaxID=1080227 RepID=A0A1C3EKW7_9GAMM|nr:nitrate reductase [Veronia pacifica]ODA33881.1 nitrate reductase [Veronia pacifica]
MTIKTDGWVKTTCAYCGVGCGIEAKTNIDGSLTVRGDADHPSNYGKLCAKGLTLGETVTHEGRMLSPSVAGKECQWEHALLETARQLNEIISLHGPDAVAFYVSGQLLTEDYYVVNKLAKGFIGTSSIDTNSRLCMSSSVAGHKRAFGEDCVPGCYEDLEVADLVVLTGSNLAWCHPVLFQRLKAAKQQRGTKVVVIDPRATSSCEIADLHLALSPGSDVALFNGLLSFLHREKHTDRNFIAHHTDDMELALEYAEPFKAIDEVTMVTGISSQDLMTFYQWFADNDRTVTVYSQGVNQSTSGTDKVNSIINCHLATGRVGKPGATPFSVTGQPNAMGGREVGGLANMLAAHMDFGKPEHHKLVSDFWQTDNLSQKPGLKAIEMFDAIERGDIKAVWIMATNPAVSLPDSEKINRALAKCPCVIVSDCIEDNDTLRHATIRLPAQGWGEKSGTVTNSERRISRQRKLMPSPGSAMPDWWIVCEVAKKMGFTDSFNYRNEAEIFTEHARLTALGNEKERQFRELNLNGLKYIGQKEYDSLSPIQWPVASFDCQNAIGAESNTSARLFTDSIFPTPNGKARFVSVAYSLPASQSSDLFPLIMNTGRLRDQWHTMTRTGLSSRLAEHVEEPTLFIHPKDADAYQVSQHQLVSVSSIKGSGLFRAKITAGLCKGHVFAPIHWSKTTSSSASVCTLISPECDLNSGQPEFKITPVRISAVAVTHIAVVTSVTPIEPELLNTDEVTYWSRKRLKQGYLYQIASQADISSLHNALSAVILTNEQQPIIFEGNGNIRQVNFYQGACVSTLEIEDDSCNTIGSWQGEILGLTTENMTIYRFMRGEVGTQQSEVVCACKQVTKSAIIEAIENNSDCDRQTLSACTGAGTGCGSCLSELDVILSEQTNQQRIPIKEIGIA